MYFLQIYAILTMSRETVYALTGFLSLIGIAALFLTAREIARTVAFLRVSRRADGTIVRFEERRNSEGTTKRRAVVKFTAGGREHEIQAAVAWTPPAPAIGTTVMVRYLPDAPHEAKIDNFWEIWETSLFYSVIFFAMLFFVVILIIVINA